MDKTRVTPKDFFLWAAAMIALYWSVVSFIYLVFNYIDYTFPTPTSFTPIDPYQSGVGHEMASVIVMFPLYLALMWLLRRDMKHDHSRRSIWVRRWAIILTLFVAGATIAADLISVLTTFLNGEALTLDFLLKALLVLLVAAAGFMHFIADLWGYWDEFPERQRAVVIGAALVAFVSIVAGFFIIGTPMQAMNYQLDEQKVSDLQTIQSDVVSYWQQNGKLPSSLEQLGAPLTGGTLPADGQTNQPYQYTMESKYEFKLCATFNAATAPYAITEDEVSAPVPAAAGSPVDIADSWYHDAGNQCFDRVINPAQYPVQKAQ